MKVIVDVSENKILLLKYTALVVCVNILLAVAYECFFATGEGTYNNEHLSFLAIITTISIVPFLEETLMRGILQNTLESKLKLKRWKVYFWVAVVFSVLHQEINFFPYFITSVLLSKVYDESGKKLIIPVISHSVYNAVVILILIFS